ncbi:MAG: aminotransferase class I/II-fold pyridoxal phosphate-dependent enzyme [Cyanothece sp. SIO2G6]|nr:aminotransferase class I/II-fold pyridoxal phosphate-dependent enzyme [Cyanothece sp. SIO2G6]
MVQCLQEIGVNEIACLIDFGVDYRSVMASLDSLNSLRKLASFSQDKKQHQNSEFDIKPTSNPQQRSKTGATDLLIVTPEVTPETSSENSKSTLEEERLNIDLDSRLHLAYKSSKNVLQRAREFELPDQLRETGLLPYFRELERNEGATCVFDGRQVIMLGSNNYLGLTADKRVREATARAALEEGPSLTGSRLLNGSTRHHREFEHKLATFLGYEDALIFTTGYQANLGFISALMNEETTLVLDSEAHACIYDGAFMSRCNVVQYHHNDLEDLEKQLQEVVSQSATMVAIDGVYSMTGDLAPLSDIRTLCDRYNVALAVDDAHGLGMLGAKGKGTEEHFQMIGSSDILCGTFSKSLASIGGWVAAEAKVIDWIRFYGRSMLFSASIPPTSLAAASTALDILIAEPWRVQHLKKNAQYWQEGLKQLGFNVGESNTAITPVIIGDDLTCMMFGKELLAAGIYVNVVVYPAVPRSKALLRTSVMATHSQQHLDQALEIFNTVGKQLELIA